MTQLSKIVIAGVVGAVLPVVVIGVSNLVVLSGVVVALICPTGGLECLPRIFLLASAVTVVLA
ncbi:hypothetical protein [Nonomuraea turcica]|uniref:hypothetical protein n=1 Tax=Nonomuraea sp. G32 TaxID=3067274 RepID=UPI00273AD7CA|nr:hypothetical protein [Nonomuraea sp. G32]MDP4511245.1 hypothetical protein [Nonomuraea sp. G32]